MIESAKPLTRLFHGLENRLRQWKQLLTMMSEENTLALTMEKLAVKIPLQCLDGMAHRRLGQMKFASSLSEAARTRQGGKRSELSGVDGGLHECHSYMN